MKKILFLAFALVLAVGMTAAAADISFSGEVETEVQGFNYGAHGSTGVEFNVDVQVDEFNSLYFETAGAAEDDELDLGEAALHSDLGAWIGSAMGDDLPFGLVYTVGFAEWSYENIAEVSAYELEGLQVFDFEAVGQKFALTFEDMVNVYFAHSYGALVGGEVDGVAVVDANDTDLPQLIVGADAMIPLEGLGSLGVEVVYSKTDADRPGADVVTDHLGFGAYFGMDQIVPDLSGSLGASFTMDLTDYDDAEDGLAEFFYGVGGEVSYLEGLVGASFSFAAAEEWENAAGDDVTAMALGLGLSSSPVDFLSFDLGLGLGLDDDYYGETMNSADVSMTFSPGAASFTLGYWWVNDDSTNIVGSLNAVDDGVDDGNNIYFSAGLEY